MAEPRHLHPSDLRGLASLGVHGVTATTNLVEHLHHSITRVPGLHRASRAPRTRGITGMVYRSIHGVTGVVGSTLKLALGAIDGSAGDIEATPERARALAILNGVLGDHLETTGNPLATAMTLRQHGPTAAPERSERLAIFLHGLCMDERCWQPSVDADEASDLPEALAAGGWSVAHLRYNTGRHIHQNGRDLERLLARRIDEFDTPPREIALIGHSMGGLVARSALHRALERGSTWAEKCSLRLVCIGTPHHGSPVERAGHGIDRLLGISRYSAPFARLGKMRSAGITDLRHGNVLAGDAGHEDRFHPAGDSRNPTRLPPQTRCFTVAATLDRDAEIARSRYVGDGWVPVPSALGLHPDPRLTLPFEADQTLVVPETGHIALLNHPEVVRRVGRWLR